MGIRRESNATRSTNRACVTARRRCKVRAGRRPRERVCLRICFADATGSGKEKKREAGDGYLQAGGWGLQLCAMV